MTTERKELATAIANRLDTIFGKREFGPAHQDYELADALIELGYRKPRTVTTADELDALPNGSVVLLDSDANQKQDGVFWGTDGGWMTARQAAKSAPITVLHEGEA